MENSEITKIESGDNLDFEIEEMASLDENNGTPSQKNSKSRKRKPRWIWLGILIFLLAVVFAVWRGYENGVQRRLDNQNAMVMEQVSLQLEKAYEDISTGSYENAKTRLEYIIQIYPGFPTAQELLTEVSIKLESPTATPTTRVFETATSEVSITATPDLRGVEETFNQIVQNILDQRWDDAIQNVLSIKENNFDYKRIIVDGYYFIALRNRGIQKIYAGELEQGMYDLSVAKNLGALDGQAEGAYNFASTYLTAASYWDVNWAAAVQIFEQLYQAMPYFSETGGMTTAERYRIALYRLGDQYASQGDYCSASEYYKRSLAVGINLDIQTTASYFADTCAASKVTPEPPTETPVIEPTPTPEITPTEP